MAGDRSWLHRVVDVWREKWNRERKDIAPAASSQSAERQIIDRVGEWAAKSETEAVRECFGHIGNDSRTQRDFPGIQVRKDGVIEPVMWGPERPTAQDADIESRMMRDRYLEFSPPDMRQPTAADTRKSDAMSQQLGMRVHTKAWRNYAREYAREHLSEGRQSKPSQEQKPKIKGPRW